MFETTNQLLNMGLIINHHKISQVGVDGVRIIDQGWHLRGVWRSQLVIKEVPVVVVTVEVQKATILGRIPLP